MNEFRKTLASCKDYPSRFPDGSYTDDMCYRLAFIDFNDKEVDQSNKTIKDLTTFLQLHPDDTSAGSMYCLLAYTYKKKTTDKPNELAKFQSLAIEAYCNAVWSDSSDDVIQYALNSATTLMSDNKDWAGIATMYRNFLQKKRDNALALLSATWVAKMKPREDTGAEAAQMLADALKSRIGNPSAEQVEFLIHELIKTIVPRKKASEVDLDALDKQLITILTKAITG